MKSVSVSHRSTVARCQQSYRVRLEQLEDRSVPGSVLGLSGLDAHLGVLAQATLGPVADLAVATTQAPAVPVGPEVSDSAAAVNLDNALVPLPATQSQAAGSPQAPGGTGLPIQATTLLGGFPGPKIVGQPPGIVNGDFHAGFSNWTLAFDDGNVGTDHAGTGNFGFQRPFTNEAVLGSVGDVDSLSQVFFSPNISYTISFDLAHDGGTPNQFLVLFNGQAMLNLVDSGAFGPTHFSRTFSASVPGTTPPIHIYESVISFVERQDPAYWYLTNVKAV